MEKLKPLSDVLSADPRNFVFVRMDTLKPSTMEEHHAEIAYAALEPSVPDEIRSYFATIQNVCLYAWFAYDLYAIVDFLCLTALEMALRTRLPFSGPGEDKRGLQNLMDQAMKRNLIRDKAFRHAREIRKNLADELRLQRSIGRKLSRSTIPRIDYTESLRKWIPTIRNKFAHPRMHMILSPSDAMVQLRLTAEFINQLFIP